MGKIGRRFIAIYGLCYNADPGIHFPSIFISVAKLG